MKRIIALNGMLVAFVGMAAADYSYEDESAGKCTLAVRVADGETQSFDASYLDPAGGASVTNVVKRGAGIIVFDSTDVASYQFDLRIEQGVCKVKNNGTFSIRPCQVEVCDNATFWNAAAADAANFSKMTIYFRGRGHNGMGALYKDGGYDWGYPFGSKMVLTGDARVALRGNENTLSNNGDGVDLQGHTLDVAFSGLLYCDSVRYKNLGRINWLGMNSGVNEIRMKDWVTFAGDSSKMMTFSNVMFKVSAPLYPDSCQLDSKLAFSKDAYIALGKSAGVYKDGSNRNYWKGPVEIDESALRVEAFADDAGMVGFAFGGKVSGGGLDLVGRTTSTLHFTLQSSENDFTGGVRAVNAVLHVATNGVLPSTGGVLCMTNSTLLVEDNAVCSLPAGEFNGNCVVSNGYGRWNGVVTKSGGGVLRYDASLSADCLDVQGGSVNVVGCDGRRRRALAGLVYGETQLEEPPHTPDKEFIGLRDYIFGTARNGVLGTNHVERGLERFYSSTPGLSVSTVYSYTGYIWNNALTNQLWAFAGDSTRSFRFEIDGQTLLGYCKPDSVRLKVGYAEGTWYADVATNTYVMTPGPHAIRLVIATKFDESGSAQGYSGYEINHLGTFLVDNGTENWADNMPIMFNDVGKVSRDYRDYRKLIDPGDGSLLTCALPSDPVSKIGTTELVDTGVYFDAAKFAPGTMASFGGCDQVFKSLCGWPTITDGDVELSGIWSFNPAEVGVAQFAIDGKLTLGPDVSFAFLEGGKLSPQYRHCDVLLGTASNGIFGLREYKTADGLWRVFVDGNSLKAQYYGRGLMLLVR